MEVETEYDSLFLSQFRHQVIEDVEQPTTVQIDYQEVDDMTNRLMNIPVLTLSSNDKSFQRMTKQVESVIEDEGLLEKWYEHVYDYFCGRLAAGIPKAKGLVYNNYIQFLRIVALN